jgi:hypothetical protein
VIDSTLEAYAPALTEVLPLSDYAFLDPASSYALPKSFNFRHYIDTEREFWALFPETGGKRVNFCQLGLTAQLYLESDDDGSELAPDETYFLMPCPDLTLRPVRMRAFRRLTLTEYRMTHLTAVKLLETLAGASCVMEKVHMKVLGPEVLGEC